MFQILSYAFGLQPTFIKQAFTHRITELGPVYTVPTYRVNQLSTDKDKLLKIGRAFRNLSKQDARLRLFK